MGYLKRTVHVGIYFDLLAGGKETTLYHRIQLLISCGFCRGSVSSLEHGGFFSLHNLDTFSLSLFFFLNRLIFFSLVCVYSPCTNASILRLLCQRNASV